MCRMTGWAMSGHEAVCLDPPAAAAAAAETTAQPSRPKRTPAEGQQPRSAWPLTLLNDVPLHVRAAVGTKVKRLLDLGRLRWLQAHGLTAEIVRYADETTTGEGQLLLARV